MTRRSKDPKSGYRLTCAANGVDHKRCVLVLKTGCVTDAKCMSKKDHDDCSCAEKKNMPTVPRKNLSKLVNC